MISSPNSDLLPSKLIPLVTLPGDIGRGCCDCCSTGVYVTYMDAVFFFFYHILVISQW